MCYPSKLTLHLNFLLSCKSSFKLKTIENLGPHVNDLKIYGNVYFVYR